MLFYQHDFGPISNRVIVGKFHGGHEIVTSHLLYSFYMLVAMCLLSPFRWDFGFRVVILTCGKAGKLKIEAQDSCSLFEGQKITVNLYEFTYLYLGLCFYSSW